MNDTMKNTDTKTTMTQRDFQSIANIINQIESDKERDAVAHLFARNLFNHNPRFDAFRFLKACNV